MNRKQVIVSPEMPETHAQCHDQRVTTVMATQDTRKNVKERLNSLLHKKILDQRHERTETAPEDGSHGSRVAAELADGTERDEGNASGLEEDEEQEEDDTQEDVISQFVLHEVLNEKKKALLQNTDVVRLLQGKFKFT